MTVWRDRRFLLLAAVLASAVLAGCGSTSLNPAPVEDRSGALAKPATPSTPAASAASAPTAPVKQLPGAENAGKPGYYTVKPGDTLIRIGLDNNQNYRDIARWNGLDNPNQLEVGQVLRVLPPSANVASAPAAPGVVTKPVTSGAVVATAPGTAASAPAKPAAAATGSVDDDIAWIWPANGGIIGNFDGSKSLGVDIEGKAGDPVLASADGTVVYVGAAVRAYGNLIILKHNNSYVTAYAHNQSLLVKEDQAVKKGQKIAEMGSSDADRVKLHFELRRQGKAVDPVKYLPPR
jgi:lipoprotein NlpD